MAHQTNCLIAFTLLISSGVATAETLSGDWQCSGSDGRHSLTFRDESTLLYDSEASAYMVMGDTLLVEEDYGVASYGYRLQGKKLTIQFPDGSLLNCQRGRAAKQQAPAIAAKPSGGVESTTLQSQIAGTWWGYAGATERKIGLCPDGSYLDYTESSYSGRSYGSGGDVTGAWGAASQGGNRGRWTIQGDYQRGTITVQTVEGGTFTLHYSQVGEPGCLDINGNRLCRTSARCE